MYQIYKITNSKETTFERIKKMANKLGCIVVMFLIIWSTNVASSSNFFKLIGDIGRAAFIPPGYSNHQQQRNRNYRRQENKNKVMVEVIYRERSQGNY